MINFGIKYKISLKGIIDYEIDQKLGLNYFYVPVFYGSEWSPGVVGDALSTNYVQVARDVRDNSIKYLTEVEKIPVSKIVVEEIERPWYNPITNSEETSYLYAYKLTIKK